ncbi:MAG: hypothetical protein AB1659_00065 [Thermodesulfobacteriota bacterium]
MPKEVFKVNIRSAYQERFIDVRFQRREMEMPDGKTNKVLTLPAWCAKNPICRIRVDGTYQERYLGDTSLLKREIR